MTVGDVVARISVEKIEGGRVRLGIEAPQSFLVKREELPGPEYIRKERSS